MMARLQALARRRASLVEEIGVEREHMARTLDSLRRQAALAGLGALAMRLVGRRRWFRWFSAAATVAVVAVPAVSRWFAARR